MISSWISWPKYIFIKVEGVSRSPKYMPSYCRRRGGSVPDGKTNDTAKQIALLHGRIVIGDNFHHDHPLSIDFPSIGEWWRVANCLLIYYPNIYCVLSLIFVGICGDRHPFQKMKKHSQEVPFRPAPAQERGYVEYLSVMISIALGWQLLQELKEIYTSI